MKLLELLEGLAEATPAALIKAGAKDRLQLRDEHGVLTRPLGGEDIDRARRGDDCVLQGLWVRARLEEQPHEPEGGLRPRGPHALLLQPQLEVAARQEAPLPPRGPALDRDHRVAQAQHLAVAPGCGLPSGEQARPEPRREAAAEVLDHERAARGDGHVPGRDASLREADVAARRRADDDASAEREHVRAHVALAEREQAHAAGRDGRAGAEGRGTQRLLAVRGRVVPREGSVVAVAAAHTKARVGHRSD